VSSSDPFDDPVPRTVVLLLDDALRVLEAIEDARLTLRERGAAPGLQDELATVIRVLHGSFGLDEGGCAVSENEVLLPAEAARRLGVATRVIVQAMYEKRLPRVKLEDGTLGIPADALDPFRVQSA
jgi:hypothetical protein